MKSHDDSEQGRMELEGLIKDVERFKDFRTSRSSLQRGGEQEAVFITGRGS